MKQRILVVDDNHLVADTLSLIFQRNGYESEAVYSAAAGLALARTFAPGLLLCDVTMPGETGLQLAEALNREMPACKLIMFTAYSSNAARVEEHATQMQRPLKLLNKPCRPELLLSACRALLHAA